MSNSLFPRLHKHSRGLRLIVGCCAALLVAACGGSGSNGLTTMATGRSTTGMPGTMGGTPGGTATAMSCSGSCGGAMVTMTDAAGDFLSYIVTLTSLQLQTVSGASVETLPAPTPVDFTKLVNLTEVLSAGQIPAADYVSAQLTLEFRECTDYRRRRDGQSRDAVSGGCQGKRVDRHSDRYCAAR